MSVFRLLGKSVDEMHVAVTIGVPQPQAVDVAAVAGELPHGVVTVTVVSGALEVATAGGADAIVIANAAVVVRFDDGT